MRVRQGFITLGVAVALVAGACSSNQDDGASAEGGGDEDGATTTTEGDGSLIVIGGVGTLTGFAGVDEGVNARLERANAEGGVLGHPLEYLGMTDDAGAADANLAAVRELVQQEDVDAVVPVIPVVLEPQAAQFMLDEGVPYVGMGFGPAMCNNEAGFAFNGCNVPGLSEGERSELLQHLPSAIGEEDLDGQTVAVVASDASGGDAFLESVIGVAEDLGADVTVEISGVPARATNVQPYVDEIMGGDVDIAIVVTDFTSMLAIQGGLKAAGFEGELVNFAGFVPGTLETSQDLQAALEGSLIATVFPTPLDGSEFSDQMAADLEAAGIDATFGAIVGYLSTDLYIDLLEAADGDPSRVIEVGNDDFNFAQAPGGFDIAFPEAHSSSALCSGMVTVAGGAYELIEPFSCTDD